VQEEFPRDRPVTPGRWGRFCLGPERGQGPRVGETTYLGLKTADAVIECAEHLPFNFYVGEVISRVDRVMASGPDGLTATWARDDSP
jgi:hypothetical protein